MIHIYGYSDDLIEVEGDVQDEFGDYDGGSILTVRKGNERIKIETRYNGDWSFIVTSDNTAWPIANKPAGHATIANVPDYSEHLSIDAPEGATVTIDRP